MTTNRETMNTKTYDCGLLHCMDVLEALRGIPDDSVHLVFADPPYNIGKAYWDKWPSHEEYLDWCRQWIAECCRVLIPNGAMWVSHNVPESLVDISRVIAEYKYRRVNWITWWKHDGFQEQGRARALCDWEGLNSYFPSEEFLVYHANTSYWDLQRDFEGRFIFSPIREYVNNERIRAGVKRSEVNKAWKDWMGSTGGMASHWFGESQYVVPTLPNYEWLRGYFDEHNPEGAPHLAKPHTELMAWWGKIREDHAYLRPTWNRVAKRASTVWQFVPGRSGMHPTSKPGGLLNRIIEGCSNKGETVLDPFAGSGTTLVTARDLGRKFIGVELDPGYQKVIDERLQGQPLNFDWLEEK